MDQVLSRLEAVTSRLEAVEARGRQAQPSSSGGFSPAKIGVALPGLATPAGSKQQLKPASPASSNDLLKEWDSAVQPALGEFLGTAEQLGGGVLTASGAVKDGFKAEREVMDAISQCKRPEQNEFIQLVSPVGAAMQAANFLAGDRRSQTVNHNKAVSEALQSLSWVMYSGPSCGMNPPAQHVEEAWQSAEFYANKVLIEFRSKDPKQVAWVKQLKELLMQMRTYVKTHHPAGPAWSSGGKPLSEFSARGQKETTAEPRQVGRPGIVSPAAKVSSPKPAGRAPPPPPPPPAGSLFKDRDSPSASAAPGLGAVLSAINTKGEGVTSGLKRVTDDMKSKNRSDRSGMVPASASGSRPPAQALKGLDKNGAHKARTECEQGRKWVVEYHQGEQNIVISETSPKQTIYLYKCSNSTVQVKGKVNAITIDQCTKTGVVFESLVASCELVNSSGLQVQVTGVVPTVTIDKCDGVQLFLSEASLGSAITTAKSSAVNVLIPGKQGEDMTELYIPEQFISTVQDGQLVTEAVSHSG